MRGKRQRDWPQRVIRYAVNIHEIENERDGRKWTGEPLVIFDTAHKMSECWNLAVGVYKNLRREARDKSKDERKAIFDRLYDEVYPQMAASGIPSTFYKFTWKQFQNAQEAFSRGNRGAPKGHWRLDNIILPHIDASGGKPAAYLDELRDNKPYYLRKGRTDKHLARGFITINDRRIWFDATVHRPLPEGAIIKQFALVGKKINPFGWRWELQIICETPKSAFSIADESKWITVDLGWRVMEDGLRVAYWLDYQGRHGEILLPFKCENYYIKRRREFMARHDGAYDPITDWREYAERQERADLYLEHVKNELRKADRRKWPVVIQSLFATKQYHFYERPDGAEIRRNEIYTEVDFEDNPKRKSFAYMGERSVDGLSMMRGGGLHRIARELGELAPEFLLEWVKNSATDFARLRAARLRMESFREHLYRNLVARWSMKYDCLRYEADLNLKGFAEAENQTPRQKNSQKYRQEMASLHKLKSWMEDAFAKRSKTLKRLVATGSSNTCPHCGANIECSPELMQTCDMCKATWDRDYGACLNLSKPDWPEVRAKQLATKAKAAVAR